MNLLPHPAPLWLWEFGIYGQGLQKSTKAASEAADKSRHLLRQRREGPSRGPRQADLSRHRVKLRVGQAAAAGRAEPDTLVLLVAALLVR